LLYLGRTQEAIEAVKKAIDIFENCEPDKNEEKKEEPDEKMKKIVEDTAKFNLIQYQNFLCSASFMQGSDFPQVMTECDKGMELCSAMDSEVLKPEGEKIKKEFENIKLKALAKSKGTCALDLKEQMKKEESKEEVSTLAKKSSVSVGMAATAFLMTSGVVFGTMLLMQRRRQ
jgi:hypothetical protein